MSGPSYPQLLAMPTPRSAKRPPLSTLNGGEAALALVYIDCMSYKPTSYRFEHLGQRHRVIFHAVDRTLYTPSYRHDYGTYPTAVGRAERQKPMKKKRPFRCVLGKFLMQCMRLDVCR